MKNVMLDIETLGLKPGAVVLSIAAVEFDLETGKIGKQFYQKIDLQDSLKKGLTIDASTLLWWSKLDHFTDQLHGDFKLKKVLENFSEWIGGREGDICLWGNSARFDLSHMDHLYGVSKLYVPWRHWNERDVRTLVSFAPEIKKAEKFEGVAHNPLDDCKHQIKYCCKIWDKILKD